MIDWEPVAGAVEYKLVYSSGFITNEVILKNTDSHYEIPIITLYDPNVGAGLNSVLHYTILPINNIGESEEAYIGSMQPFGDGSESNPYRVINRTTFFDIENTVGFNNFLLLRNLDLGKFDLIDNFVLNGNFDGNGKTISYGQIDTPTASNNWGLFENILSGSIVKNLNVYGDIDVSSFSNNYFGLISGSTSGRIENCHSFGKIISTSHMRLGGISGYIGSGGEIINCSSEAIVDGASYVGGIVGYNSSGTVSNSNYTNANGLFNISGDGNIGGIAGYNDFGTINNCHVSVNLSGQGFVGGISGRNIGTATVSNSSFNGNINGINNLGGITGNNGSNCTIIYSNTDCNISGSYSIGGITGENSGSIESVSAIINLNSAVIGSDSNIGGISGTNNITGEIRNSNSIGTITAQSYYIGGAVGSNTGLIDLVIADCDIVATSNTSDAFVGGLVGFHADSTISNSIAYGDISSVGNKIGGLIGECNSDLNDSHAYGNVDGNSQVGGIIGDNALPIVNNCDAYGLVTGLTTLVGSLVGYESEIITGYPYCESNTNQTPAIPVIGF